MTFSPAKRRDFAVTVQTQRVYALHTGIRHVTRITVGEVTSVTRAGAVKRIQPAADAAACGLTPHNWDSIMVFARDLIEDPDAFLAACAKRQTLDAGSYNPWVDLNDVRGTIRMHLKKDASV